LVFFFFTVVIELFLTTGSAISVFLHDHGFSGEEVLSRRTSNWAKKHSRLRVKRIACLILRSSIQAHNMSITTTEFQIGSRSLSLFMKFIVGLHLIYQINFVSTICISGHLLFKIITLVDKSTVIGFTKLIVPDLCWHCSCIIKVCIHQSFSFNHFLIVNLTLIQDAVSNFFDWLC
jgi:hypothetical protein